MKKIYSYYYIDLAIKKRLDYDDQVEYKNAKLIKHSKSMWLIYSYMLWILIQLIDIWLNILKQY